jgi:tRNA/rRNA methyltransferase
MANGLSKERGERARGVLRHCVARLPALYRAHCATMPATDADFEAASRRVRVVLARPSHPGNIGAAARALKAMGFGRLVVVAPRTADFRSAPEALALATHGADVLAGARTEDTLDAALTGVRHAYAMTGYSREFGPPLVDLRSAAAATAQALREWADGDVAFVFGSERDGLDNDEVERCGACCAIPVAAGADSLNLAQAVQITAYELRLALAGGSRIEAALQRFVDDPPADHAALEGLFEHVETALVALGYLDPAAPRRLMSRLRRLAARAGPTATEVDILRGIAAAVIAPRATRAGRKQRGEG